MLLLGELTPFTLITIVLSLKKIDLNKAIERLWSFQPFQKKYGIVVSIDAFQKNMEKGHG